MIDQTDQLTTDQKNFYLKNPTSCAYCRSERVSGEFVEVNPGYLDQRVVCAKCGRIWIEIYKLVDVEEYD